MESSSAPQQGCIAETPMPPRKRTSSYGPTSSIYSTKRRRVSMADLELKLEMGSGSKLSPATSLDRFVPSRPKSVIPLNSTPRTNRISRQFGLVDERVFNFKDDQENIAPRGDGTNMLGLLRRSASDLFLKPPRVRLSSVTENLTKRRQCILTLDGPRIPADPYACPITWSKRNLIAVACANEIFYQNLDTRVVSHMCKPDISPSGSLHTIEWAGEGRETILASGTSTGVVQIWDAGRDGGSAKSMRLWREGHSTGVGGLDWYEDSLAVGSHDGTISLFDVRSKSEARSVLAHKGKVLSLKWSTDGSLLASGDDLGVVYIWDKRAGKELFDEGTRSGKMRHRGPVKALAWCTWKPDLLATGSIQPEGKIKVWSALSASASPTPLETITLNTSVLSLHWSPHCKELLSTHGSSFSVPPPSTRSSTTSTPTPPRQQLKTVASPLTNSIAVHEYPSGARLLSLTAHFGPVTHSCLSPDGQSLFTVCPKEETIKMWQVWSKRTDLSKRESAFDKCTIR